MLKSASLVGVMNMADLDTLSKIDLIRERADVSYEEAKSYLDAGNDNVVEALIAIEHREKSRREQYQVRGTELVDKVKGLLRKANVTKIRVKQDDRLVLELPVSAGVVGAVVAPELAILGAVAALFTKCTVEVERAAAEGLH